MGQPRTGHSVEAPLDAVPGLSLLEGSEGSVPMAGMRELAIRAGEPGPGVLARSPMVATLPHEERAGHGASHNPGRRRGEGAVSPEEWLARAMAAETPRTRGLRARRGLATPKRIDRTTQSMLLRQLSLAYLEQRQFLKAAAVAAQAVRLGVLVDVLHQDVARALQARGDLEGAIHHLRLAERSAPASRRATHSWSIGATLHLGGRPREALPPLERAVRWATRDKPLFQAQLALVRCDLGEPISGLAAALLQLAEAPVGQGYGRFLLGEMAWRLGRLDEAEAWLNEFLARVEAGRPAMALSLQGESRRAKQTLERIAAARG